MFSTEISKALLTAVATTALMTSPALAQTSEPVPSAPTVASPPGLYIPVADLVERVSPAVVNVVTRTSSGETTTEGQGSGFLISKEGEVVTNYHVIEGGTTISVVFNNGAEFDAQIIGTDEETDLALLRINSAEPFPYVKFYDGDPIRIGDWVVAIGNPFGIGQSTSLGIISAIGRDRVESGAYVDYIQTDATINRGNSGGPLFNPYGAVVGVNSAIFSPTGASVGIAFSIPHYTAEDIVTQLRTHGRVRRGWLGAGLRTAEFSGSGRPTSGAHINNVVRGGPADKAGLQVDDIILSIDGVRVANAVEATRLIGKIVPGSQSQMLIDRSEQEMTVTLNMEERPGKDEVERAMSGGSYAAPSPQPTTPSRPSTRPGAGVSTTGLSLVDLSSTFRESIGMRYDQVGVYVERVAPGSAADQAQIKSNMVILEMEQKPIPSVREFRRMISDAQRAGKSQVLLLLRMSDGRETYVNLSLSGARVGTANFETEPD